MTKTDFLIEAVNQGVNYSIQYSDYTDETWTAPVLLTHKRLAFIIDDHSVKRIRLEFDKNN